MNEPTTPEPDPPTPLPPSPPPAPGFDFWKLAKALAILAVLATAAVLTVMIGPWVWLQQILESSKRELLGAGVPAKLAAGLMILGGIPFVLAFMRMFGKRPPFLDKSWPNSKLAALIIVLVYAGAFPILIWHLSDRVAFAIPRIEGEKGFEQRFYCSADFSEFTKPGTCPEHGRPLLKVVKLYCPVDLEYFEGAGVCPRHGKDLQIVTPVVVSVKEQRGRRTDVTPRMIELSPDGPFYATATGFPIAFFGQGLDGRLRAFNYPGVDGSTGAPLREPTPALIAAWYAQRRHELDSLRAVVLPQEPGKSPPTGIRNGTRTRTRPPVEPPCDIGGLLGQVSMEPDNAQLHAHLARCYEREGDRPGAVREYREVLRLDPNSTAARQALTRLGGLP